MERRQRLHRKVLIYGWDLGLKESRTYLKNNLSAHVCVVKRLKMLTYYVYAPLLNRLTPCLDSNLIFEIGSNAAHDIYEDAHIVRTLHDGVYLFPTE